MARCTLLGFGAWVGGGVCWFPDACCWTLLALNVGGLFEVLLLLMSDVVYGVNVVPSGRYVPGGSVMVPC